jgi:hypothetical protein
MLAIQRSPLSYVGATRSSMPSAIQGQPGLRHVVLPADQGPEPAHRRVDHPQAAGIAEAPDHALGVRRHQLAVAGQQLAVRPYRDDGVVERGAAERRVALVHPADDRHLMLSRGLLQRLQMRLPEIDRVGQQPGVDLFGQGHVRPRPQPPDPRRITRHEGLGKDDEPGAIARRLAGPGRRGLDRLRPVEHDRRLLDDRDACHGAWLLCHARTMRRERWNQRWRVRWVGR